MRGVVEHIDRKQIRGHCIDPDAPARPVTVEALWQGAVVATGRTTRPAGAAPPGPAQPGPFAIALPPLDHFTPRAVAAALQVRARPDGDGAPHDLPVAATLAEQLGWRAPAAMPEGRIAYLFLCARAPQVFGRAVRALHDARDAVFAHVDSKADQAPFEDAAAGLDVRFVGERIAVTWGTFRMIEAELALIHAARAAGRFDRFVLLSDNSFPLRPRHLLRAALLGGRIGFGARAIPATETYFFDRYAQFHFFGSRSPREGRKGFDAADAPALRELADFIERHGKKPVRLHHGSQWMVLRAAEVEAILQAHADEHLRRSFEYSLIPDEHYFQTILAMRDGFVSRAEAMHVDWSVSPGPRTFREPSETLDALWSRRLFLRKIDPEAPALLDFLEAEAGVGVAAAPSPPPVAEPDATAASVVAVHPHWRSLLHLDAARARVRHDAHGTTGSYRMADGRLEIAWDRFPAESFAWRDGVYVHLSLLPAAATTGSG